MDNTATKAHINCQGGIHSRALMQEANLLGLWAESHLSSLQAEHILGVTNVQADWLSHSEVDHAEWSIHLDLFQVLTHWFSLPVLNLFVTLDNNQLPRYFTRYAALGSEGVDVLRCQWPPNLLYAFLLLPLIQRVRRRSFYSWCLTGLDGLGSWTS